MNEWQSDFDLLQAFVRHGEQPAFAEVIRRHLDLVFGTAFRKVQEQGAAQEVAQNVFAALVPKAWQFAPDDSLAAWLHKSALLESKDWLRAELRRRRREQTAAELGTTMNTPEDQPALRALVPLLDEALLSLREKDGAETRRRRARQAVLLFPTPRLQNRNRGRDHRRASAHGYLGPGGGGEFSGACCRTIDAADVAWVGGARCAVRKRYEN